MQVYLAFNSYIDAIPNSEIANTIRVVDNDMITVSDEARFLVEEKVDFSRMLKKYIEAIEGDDVGLVEMSGIKVGEKYTSSYLMNLLQKAYDSASISRKAVSYDILNYFSAKKTQVVGEDGKRKQGYLILDDLYKEDYL